MRGPLHRLLVAAFLTISTLSAARADTFEDDLLKAFNLPQTARIVWPPRAAMEAGSVVDPALRVVAREPRVAVVKTIDSPPVVVVAPVDRLQPLDGLWIWRAFLSEPNRFEITLNLSSLESVDLSPTEAPPPSFVRTPDPEKIKREPGVVTIQRSWRATATLEVLPGPTVSASEWLALRKLAISDSSETVRANAKSVTLTFPGKPTLAIQSDVSGNRPSTANLAANTARGPKRWALATIASGRYQFLTDMQQDWNERSANLAAEALSDWRPVVTRALTPSDQKGLSRQGVLDFLSTFVRDARQARAELMVVYYVGHMERSGTGALSLLMGDAPAERIVSPTVATHSVGNLRDLAQIVDRAEAELAPRPGTLDVAAMHRQLARAQLPFVLLVDGCLEDPTYREARERLGIVVDARGGEPIYVGPGDQGTALNSQLAELRNYPNDFPYLKSAAPIVLGATPGTAANQESNPVWLLGGAVGPIARRLFDTVARTRWDPERPSLIRILNFTADRQSIGPQELTGTVSWSDWLPYLHKFDAASFKQ